MLARRRTNAGCSGPIVLPSQAAWAVVRHKGLEDLGVALGSRSLVVGHTAADIVVDRRVVAGSLLVLAEGIAGTAVVGRAAEPVLLLWVRTEGLK